MYAIANYLTGEQKRRALSVEYAPTALGPTPRPCSPEGYCPLGYAIGEDALAPYGQNAKTPGPAMVTKALGYDYSSVWWLDVWRAATEFILNWDNGRIGNLAEALGMTNEPSE